MREYSLGKRLVEGYLNQPYTWFLDRHSADIGKTILTEAEKVSSGVIRAIMDMISAGTIALALFALLIFTDPKLAISGFVLGVSYLLIYKASRNYLGKIGEERLKANQSRFTVISEAFCN